MTKKYIVEARNPDGTFNAKYYNPADPAAFITGITGDALAAWYFLDSGSKAYSVSMAEVFEHLKARGLVARVKTW